MTRLKCLFLKSVNVVKQGYRKTKTVANKSPVLLHFQSVTELFPNPSSLLGCRYNTCAETWTRVRQPSSRCLRRSSVSGRDRWTSWDRTMPHAYSRWTQWCIWSNFTSSVTYVESFQGFEPGLFSNWFLSNRNSIVTFFGSGFDSKIYVLIPARTKKISSWTG